MTRPHWHLPFGAQWQNDGTTLFRLWAPGTAEIGLEIEGAGVVPMPHSGEGWFALRKSCTPGTAYRYVLPDGACVPDPASRAQRGGVHGWSLVGNPDYPWRTPEWSGRPWNETILYEAHVGAMGGFAGVRRALPDLAALGITALELMPIADFPGERSWGYDGVLPYAPAAAYGTPEDLKALIDAAHGLGIMMFLDVVYNHFGPDGNYLNLYAADLFNPALTTPWGAAIAFDRAPVADFFVQNALYWLHEYRFDGLRLDAVHAILPHGSVESLGAQVRAGLPEGRHVHLVLENEHNDATLLPAPFNAQWNDDIHHCIHVLLTGETEGYYRDFADKPAERLARCLATGFAYQGEPSVNLGRPRGTPSDALPPTAFVSFVQNHDQVGNRAMGERLTAIADLDALRAAIALVLLAPQIPMIFMGEEIGTTAPFLFFTDHNPELAELVREGRRNEFRTFAAFQDAERRARIPDPNHPDTFAASIPRPSDTAFNWRAFYGTLIELRQRYVIPQLGNVESLGAQALSEDAVTAAWRLADGSVLTISSNFGGTDIAAPQPRGTVLAFVCAEGDTLAPGLLPACSTCVTLSPAPFPS